MFEVTLVQIAILWSIAGLAIICALNTQRLIKHIISWLVVIAITALAVFFSYVRYEDFKQEAGLSASSESTAKNSDSDNAINAVDTENYLQKEKLLFEEAAKISDSILSFPQWKYICSQGIERRESFESKALYLRNKSMNSYRQIRNLSLPINKKQTKDSLLAAAENLRLAGYEIHHQFALEADSLGESIKKAYNYANQAKSIFFNITNKE